MSAIEVNDIHSELTPTRVAEVAEVDGLAAIQRTLEQARASGRGVAIAGGRHAMGGQQFLTDGVLIDTRPLRRVLDLDSERGVVQVEAGIQWPELIEWLSNAQPGAAQPWTIAQKQTGADRLSLGGSVSANAHGRGLDMGPLVADVESLVLVDAQGVERRLSRDENRDLFRLVVGGYGLFGVIHSVALRLVPRQTLERVVEVVELDGLMAAFDGRTRDGFVYGDFQFMTDDASPDFLTRGVFSCYRPVDPATPMPESRRLLSREDWGRLLYLAHVDKAAAYQAYVTHYLATSGQLYRSDELQRADYVDAYHRQLDPLLGHPVRGTEVISELYVPRDELAGFMRAAAEEIRRTGADLIYGTLRLIRRDDETFLPWARRDYACVIFNFHTPHDHAGLERSALAFRRLIDLAAARDGSFYLTYHRHATRDQLEACYPRFAEFLRLKRSHDPDELFRSDWYLHYRELFSGG